GNAVQTYFYGEYLWLGRDGSRTLQKVEGGHVRSGRSGVIMVRLSHALTDPVLFPLFLTKLYFPELVRQLTMQRGRHTLAYMVSAGTSRHVGPRCYVATTHLKCRCKSSTCVMKP
ncbi:hypothetical protein F443_05110, partial [Phytophthora nicotianae P1569]